MKNIFKLLIFMIILFGIPCIYIYSSSIFVSELETAFESGPITEVPWENDPEFKQAKIDNDVPILLSAYKAVLIDPMPGEENNVHIGAQKLCGIVIKPGEVFSQNKAIGPYTLTNGYQSGPTYFGIKIGTTIGGGVCKLASTLYNVSVMSNLEIKERHNHTMPVPYVPYGQDATVSYGNKDIRFKNTTSEPIMIWAKGIDNILYIGLYGRTKPPKVTWHHEILEIDKAKTYYRDNKKLPVGIENVVMLGMDGGKIKTWITVEYDNGTTETKQMGLSIYKPINHIIERGVKK